MLIRFRFLGRQDLSDCKNWNKFRQDRIQESSGEASPESDAVDERGGCFAATHYNIRSNFFWYLKDQVDQSLFRTTIVETPSFQDILNRLSSSLSARDNGLDDFHQLTKTIHVVWHMYRAHVKIAFLIYMREVHDIDIRDGLSGKRVGTQPWDEAGWPHARPPLLSWISSQPRCPPRSGLSTTHRPQCVTP